MKFLDRLKKLFEKQRAEVWPPLHAVPGIDRASGRDETVIAYFSGPPNFELVEDACGNVWRRLGPGKYRLEEQHGVLPSRC